MRDAPHDRQTAALYRLLSEAAHGGQAKVDALLALMQRTLFVAPWPAGTEGYRTLVNSQGIAALPVFTEREQLEAAARRYGWLAADGSVPAIEIGARQAFHYARAQTLAFVVVDIAAEHGLEVAREELEPLLSPAARRESSGPFAGAGRISSTLMSKVRPHTQTPTPGSIESPIRAATPPPGSLPSARSATGSSPGTIARPPTPASGSSPGTLRRPSGSLLVAPTEPGTVLASAKLGAPVAPIDEALLEALEPVLRAFPEVEWACLGTLDRDPVIGLRVDSRMRQRVEEIASHVATAASPATLPVVLLDDPQDMRAARADALVFYPWRRR
ncbi:SseB family protein [Sandaracinus amylolyticus]|uniref:SseB protein N-terminal domain-containing protein n=1 Tax=Sandaracinus amylolyticus TaxID=927083 RepID=A0A0F6YFA6_9BACT|nr:SseB family protein [Sandaracinus amylolyticus]AKF03376.1 hypothetical protein DB32_000525 [Sandaracinus amylolyticus]